MPNVEKLEALKPASELLLGSFLKEGSNPRFRPSLRCFTDEFIICNKVKKHGGGGKSYVGENIRFKCKTGNNNLILTY